MGRNDYGAYAWREQRTNRRRVNALMPDYRTEPVFRTDEEQDLLRELTAYRRYGCDIYINGHLCGPERVVDECLREHRVYMRDFLDDDDENIRGINFIRIRSR